MKRISTNQTKEIKDWIQYKVCKISVPINII